VILNILKYLLWPRAADFQCLHQSQLESVTAVESHVTETCSGSDLTKHNVVMLPVYEKENVVVGMITKNLIACENL
jgi:hypothetical protein